MSNHDFDLQNIRLETFNPKTLFLSVIDQFQPLLDQQHLSIRCTDEGIGDEITTEPYILRQIIVDLLKSVIDYSHREIEIQLEDSPREPNTFVFMIEARTFLISADKLTELYLSHPPLHWERAKHLVKALSGTIQLNSNETNITAFIVTLPIKKPFFKG